MKREVFISYASRHGESRFGSPCDVVFGGHNEICMLQLSPLTRVTSCVVPSVSALRVTPLSSLVLLSSLQGVESFASFEGMANAEVMVAGTRRRLAPLCMRPRRKEHHDLPPTGILRVWAKGAYLRSSSSLVFLLLLPLASSY